jgi:hypothetical protein
MSDNHDVLLVQGVRMAAALINELDGGKLPSPLSTGDRITERRKGELTIERVVPGQRHAGHPTIQVRRSGQTLVHARLAPGWEDSDLGIEIVDRGPDVDWVEQLAGGRVASQPVNGSATRQPVNGDAAIKIENRQGS